MNKQQIFDRVAVHLLTQGKQALNSDGQCVYHSSDGYKCAIGCLIPDDKYKPEFEGYSAFHDKIVEAIGIDYNYSLRELQGIHDGYKPEMWERKLREFADKYNLSTAVIYIMSELSQRGKIND